MAKGFYNAGNRYHLTHTVFGVPTFRHISTGETLHAQAGPYEEACALYLNPSKLLERHGDVTIYDMGLGCGSNMLICREAFEKNVNLKTVKVISFDLEKLGLSVLLQHLEHFSFAQKHCEFLTACLKQDHVFYEYKNNRTFEWTFVEGDFAQTVHSSILTKNKSDIIFYDFFSPKSHPELWRFSLFQKLFLSCNDRAQLFTYSSATRIRANLAAAGFYIGYGEASGKKQKSTVAAKEFCQLKEPIPKNWKDTFLRSHLAFFEEETLSNRALITENILKHPQFAESL